MTHLSKIIISQARTRGFTLIEVMVVVAILAVLASFAAPGMAQFLSARRVEDVARRLGEDMAVGRNEAVKRNAPVLLCTDVTGACVAAPNSADWMKGWRVCFDANADGDCDDAAIADPNPIRIQSPIAASVTLTGPISRLNFNPNGSITATDFAAFTAQSASLPSLTWVVRVAASGAVSVRKN